VKTPARRLSLSLVAIAVLACDSADQEIAAVAPGCGSENFAEVVVTPASLLLLVGDSTVVTAKAALCSTLPVPFAVTWSSSNQAVASVDSLSGRVRALAPGQGTIIATIVGDSLVKGAAAVQVNAR